MTIRLATINDLSSIIAIYNEFIGTTVTMDTLEANVESKQGWFVQHSNQYPIFCFFTPENEVVGWASLSKWSEKPGYKYTVENSLYITKSYQNKGIGSKLLEKLIETAKDNQFHCVISRIDANNNVSINLHKKFGFIAIGTMKEIGFKFNRFIDVTILQLLL
jgi:phosphinothricin acetyltransferase